jgi:hypothetical protein
MSEFKEPKIGDKIIIPKGFTLVGCDIDYKKVYEVEDYFYHKVHNMHFITFVADGKKYSFPPVAFDLASDEEITAGHRIDDVVPVYADVKFPYKVLTGEQVGAVTMGFDTGKDITRELEILDKPENDISPNCKAKDV